MLKKFVNQWSVLSPAQTLIFNQLRLLSAEQDESQETAQPAPEPQRQRFTFSKNQPNRNERDRQTKSNSNADADEEPLNLGFKTASGRKILKKEEEDDEQPPNRRTTSRKPAASSTSNQSKSLGNKRSEPYMQKPEFILLALSLEEIRQKLSASSIEPVSSIVLDSSYWGSLY